MSNPLGQTSYPKISINFKTKDGSVIIAQQGTLCESAICFILPETGRVC